MRYLFLALGFASLVSGCLATSGGGVGSEPAGPALTSAQADGSFSLTAIDDAALPAGKCGMILWTLDASSPKAIMRYVSDQAAQIEINGEVVELVLAQARGGGEFGVFEEQTFSSETGYLADVMINFGLGFDGGVYVERGFIKVSAASGWEIVAPAAGIVGCRGG